MFRVVATADELLKSYVVRGIVFIDEQRCPYPLEFDGLDYSALHILGEEDGEPIACGRIRFLGEYAKLERIAVRKEFRGRKLGHELVEFMLSVAREQGYTHFKMHAQAGLADFYRQHGFEAQSEPFDEAGIVHCVMVRHD